MRTIQQMFPARFPVKYLAAMVALSVVAACSSEAPPAPPPPPPAAPNAAPRANAGPDQAVIEGDSVTLNASGSSDSDGTITRFAWTQTGGPGVALEAADTSAPRFVAPDITTTTALTFSLTVTDNAGATATDSVNISATASDSRVFTAAGVIEGERGSDGIGVFRGVRFAEAPVGNRRWRNPDPVTPFSGVVPARQFGPNCFQIASEFLVDTTLTQNLSQDCLTLNVWTPTANASANLPVMVWIHGGGNNTGSGSQASFDGSDLARQENVVVVTLNYRLGPMGYLAHRLLNAETPAGTSGNFGLRDQVLALRWVESNIARFGGNPGLVTIFGESAGGVNVCNLIASPLATGLFDRAIIQSGSCRDSLPLLTGATAREPQSAIALGDRAAALLGCSTVADVLGCMRAVPVARLYQLLAPATGEFFSGGAQGASADVYGPIVDGIVLPQTPAARIASGAQNVTPVLLGSNNNEAALFRSATIVLAGTLSTYQATVARLFGANAPRILAAYPAANDAQALPAFERLFTDLNFTCPARAAARAVSRFSGPVWLYEFNRFPPALQNLGAFHGLEIGYVFGTLNPQTFQAADTSLSNAMQGYWAQFARAGNPNGGGRVAWPGFTVAGDANLTLASTIASASGLRRTECDLLESL